MKVRQHGFTLLEMVIGITLLGFLLVLLYGGLRLATRGWEAGTGAVERASAQAAVAGYLRRQLAMAYPLRWKADNGEQKIAFEGDAQGMRFAAPIPAHLGPGGIQLLAIEMAEAGEDHPLQMRWRTPEPELRAFEFKTPPEPVMLLDRLEAVEFAYYGAQDKDTEPAWHDEWHSETYVPRLVRIQVRPKGGDAWPEMYVELKLAADASCQWDPDFRRCK